MHTKKKTKEESHCTYDPSMKRNQDVRVVKRLPISIISWIVRYEIIVERTAEYTVMHKVCIRPVLPKKSV